MIEQSKVYKCLEKKTLILGFELADLFVICLVLCLLNLFFKESGAKFFLTWGPTATLALVIRLLKTGKADNYIVHAIKYYLTPGIIKAFPNAQKNKFRKLKLKGKTHVRFKFE